MAGAERQGRSDIAGDDAAERGRVGLLAAVCAVAAILVLLLLAWPPRPYRAEALLLVMPPADSAATVREALSDASLQKLLAAPQLRLLVQEGQRRGLPSLIDDALDGVFGDVPPLAPQGAPATAWLRQRFTVTGVDGGRLVSVVAEATEARAALGLADGLSAIIVATSQPAATPAAELPFAVLETRLADARRRLAEYRAKHDGDLGAPPLSAGQRQALSLRVAEARAREAELRTRLDQAQRVSPTAPHPLDTPQLTALRHALADLSERQTRLRDELGPRHPSVAELDAGLASAARQIDIEIDRIASLAAAELQRAAASAEALAAAARALDDAAIGRDRAERGLLALEGEVEDARRALDRAATAPPVPPPVATVSLAKRAALAERRDGLPFSILAAVGLAALALGFLAGRLSPRRR